jgi:hypothetical protein
MAFVARVVDNATPLIRAKSSNLNACKQLVIPFTKLPGVVSALALAIIFCSESSPYYSVSIDATSIYAKYKRHLLHLSLPQSRL